MLLTGVAGGARQVAGRLGSVADTLTLSTIDGNGAAAVDKVSTVVSNIDASTGLKTASGDLTVSANSARTQAYGNGGSATLSPGTETAGSAGAGVGANASGAAVDAAAGRGLVYENPSSLVQTRVDDLLSQIPANSQGRITMGVAVVEDANGTRSVLVSTSEPRGYLRPGVTLQPGETVIAGTGHAEADIVSYANANGLKVIDIGATRPVCGSCQNVIDPTGANITTPLKPPPKTKP